MASQIDPNDPTVRTAVFGKQVEDFLQSDLGDYLLQMAKHDEVTAIEELIAADPSADHSQIRAKIATARAFQSWLGQAVQRGLQALELLQEDV